MSPLHIISPYLSNFDALLWIKKMDFITIQYKLKIIKYFLISSQRFIVSYCIFFLIFVYLLVALSFFSTLYFAFYFPANLMISYLPFPWHRLLLFYFPSHIISFLINYLLKSVTATDINISPNFSILLVSSFLLWFTC